MNNLNVEDNNINTTTPDANDKTGESKGVAMNIFAILGFIAILLAGLWATTQLVKQVSNMSLNLNIPNVNIFSKDKLTLIEGSELIYSGKPTAIKWIIGDKYKENEGATIALAYKCQKGLYVKVKTADDDTYRALPCNAPYTMPATSTEMVIIPVLTQGNAGELKYSITYNPQESSKLKRQSVQGALQVAIGEGSPNATESSITDTPDTTADISTTTAPTTTTKPSVTTTTTKAPTYTKVVRTVVPVRTSDPNGLPDLTVSVTNVITDSTTKLTTVRIEVSNQGTKLAQGWTLSAVLPTEPAYTYVSAPQQALYSGEKAEMLMTFDKTKSGIQDLKLTVDPNNTIVESLETNNSVELKLVN